MDGLLGPWGFTAPMWGSRYAKDDSGFPIDLHRPKLPMPGGGFQTEYSLTDRVGDRWYNYPSIWGGRMRSPEEAYGLLVMDLMQGAAYPNFASLAEAETAAKARSRKIGLLRGIP